MKPVMVKTGKGKVFQAMVPDACEKWCHLWGPGRTAGGMEGDPSAGRHVVWQARADGAEVFVVPPEQCRVAKSMNQC